MTDSMILRSSSVKWVKSGKGGKEGRFLVAMDACVCLLGTVDVLQDGCNNRHVSELFRTFGDLLARK